MMMMRLQREEVNLLLCCHNESLNHAAHALDVRHPRDREGSNATRLVYGAPVSSKCRMSSV
eukprot:scaffold1875_cov146-Skeletonema_dohrnii-CCMP3373.AAC.7